MPESHDPTGKVSLEVLDSTFIRYVEGRLECLRGCLISDDPKSARNAEMVIRGLISIKAKADALREMARTGDLTVRDVRAYFENGVKKRKPKRGKISNRYQRVMKNFL